MSRSTGYPESGFDRTTTASICRAAQVSSGTFFHYFPTKLAALVGVLVSGCEATRESLEEIEQRVRGLEAVLAYADAYGADPLDPSYGGFVHAVGNVKGLPEVVAVLEEESALVSGFTLRHLTLAQELGAIRTDHPVDRLTTWVQWVLDGAAVGAATEQQVGSSAVADALRALLLPGVSS